jgi:succinyl-CoA synthetase beta subunit
MNLHEYQSKELFSEYGIPTPKGKIAFSCAEAAQIAKSISGDKWVVKAQVHSGGRGKAGGVVVAPSIAEVEKATNHLIGSTLFTIQSGPQGLPVESVLIEETLEQSTELYLSALVDRTSERVLFIASEAGGMDIEEIAIHSPDKILSCKVDPILGLQPFQIRDIGFGLGLHSSQIASLTKIMTGMYLLLIDKDLTQIEINPLVVNKQGELIALDGKINVDDNALFAHPEMQAKRDVGQEDPAETAAREYDLSYVTLDGNIGCMVNGAGLAMATLDVIKLYGGKPANFLDVGGGTTAEKVAQAFKLILSDHKVTALLVNIFGGIVRCDLIAEGIISAVKEVGISIPVVVRLEGTNSAEGLSLIQASGLAIISASDLDDAARKAVEAAK